MIIDLNENPTLSKTKLPENISRIIFYVPLAVVVGGLLQDDVSHVAHSGGVSEWLEGSPVVTVVWRQLDVTEGRGVMGGRGDGKLTDSYLRNVIIKLSEVVMIYPKV